MKEYRISKRTQYSVLMAKDVADEPKYLWRMFLIKYFTSCYFANKYSISENLSVSGQREISYF
jgi:hypothetical protein